MCVCVYKVDYSSSLFLCPCNLYNIGERNQFGTPELCHMLDRVMCCMCVGGLQEFDGLGLARLPALASFHPSIRLPKCSRRCKLLTAESCPCIGTL